MNIIVCVKQVPASNETRLDPVTHTILRDGAAILNPFDAYAVEQALRLKPMGRPSLDWQQTYYLPEGVDLEALAALLVFENP